MQSKTNKDITGKLRAKRNTRVQVMQALYIQLSNESSLDEAIVYVRIFNDENKTNVPIDGHFLNELVTSLRANIILIDKTIKNFISIDIDKLDNTSKAIMQLATNEMLFFMHTPYKVIIKEALLLANSFGIESSYKIVNGSLDSIAQEFRKSELI